MATLTKAISKSFFDSILPVYGNPRVQTPVWDEEQKMFIFDEHEYASGNRSFRGIRFCDRVVIVEHVGKYHTCTYINSLELYAFNGTRLELIQKKDDYNKVFRDEETIRRDSETMVRNYLAGMYKAQKIAVSEGEHEALAKQLVDSCYKSFLDSDFNLRLTQIIPALENN